MRAIRTFVCALTALSMAPSTLLAQSFGPPPQGAAVCDAACRARLGLEVNPTPDPDGAGGLGSAPSQPQPRKRNARRAQEAPATATDGNAAAAVAPAPARTPAARRSQARTAVKPQPAPPPLGAGEDVDAAIPAAEPAVPRAGPAGRFQPTPPRSASPKSAPSKTLARKTPPQPAPPPARPAEPIDPSITSSTGARPAADGAGGAPTSPSAAPFGEPLSAYLLTRSSVSGLAQLRGQRIGVMPLGERAKAHVTAALKEAHLDGAIQPMSDGDALKRLLSGDLAAVVVDIDKPPTGLSDVPIETLRMIPIFAPGL